MVVIPSGAEFWSCLIPFVHCGKCIKSLAAARRNAFCVRGGNSANNVLLAIFYKLAKTTLYTLGVPMAPWSFEKLACRCNFCPTMRKKYIKSLGT